MNIRGQFLQTLVHFDWESWLNLFFSFYFDIPFRYRLFYHDLDSIFAMARLVFIIDYLGLLSIFVNLEYLTAPTVSLVTFLNNGRIFVDKHFFELILSIFVSMSLMLFCRILWAVGQ